MTHSKTQAELDFRILECSQPNKMGFINDNRALVLMKKGLIKFNPKEKWCINGYKATKKGIILYNRLIKQIRKSHGHKWVTNEDGSLDSFAYSEGYHNGYKCEKCGLCYCMHCELEINIPKCYEKSKDIILADDSKLDKGFIAMEKSIRASFGLGN